MVKEEIVSKDSERDENKEGGAVSSETNTTPILVTQAMVAAAGFNVNSPIVNAVIKNLRKLSEDEWSQNNRCSLCNIPCMDSDSDRVSHILGKKHKNKLLSLRIIKNLHRVCRKKGVVKPAEGKYMCQQCKVTVNSPIQLVSHMRSIKHFKTNTKTGIVLSANLIDDLDQPTVTYFCQHCGIHLNSNKKMIQHKASFIHLINVERNKRMKNALLESRPKRLWTF